jgi:hypothetical protein
MKRYDPDHAPDPVEWLGLGEQEREVLVNDFHRHAKPSSAHGKRSEAPNERGHASIHVVVENQLAEGLPTVVAALERLMREGLGRHNAIHAIGTALAAELHRVMTTKTPFDQAGYDAGLAELSAKRFREL